MTTEEATQLYMPLVKAYYAAQNTVMYGEEPFKSLANERSDEIIEEVHGDLNADHDPDVFWIMVRAYRHGYRDMKDRVRKLAF